MVSRHTVCGSDSSSDVYSAYQVLALPLRQGEEQDQVLREEARVFFFSSRRRHTRYWRDWSSDVCSSDLTCSYCMKTRFQISMKRSPSWSADPGGPPGILSPWSKKISVQGPHGPVSPMRQKLSAVGMRMIRLSGRDRKSVV